MCLCFSPFSFEASSNTSVSAVRRNSYRQEPPRDQFGFQSPPEPRPVGKQTEVNCWGGPNSDKQSIKCWIRQSKLRDSNTFRFAVHLFQICRLALILQNIRRHSVHSSAHILESLFQDGRIDWVKWFSIEDSQSFSKKRRVGVKVWCTCSVVALVVLKINNLRIANFKLPRIFCTVPPISLRNKSNHFTIAFSEVLSQDP